jgi:thiol-disulfide isomerase/thioredoxin
MIARNIFFSVMVFVGLCAQAQQPARPFKLKGTIQGMDKGWLYLHYSTPDGKRLKDSAEVKKEKFTFRGKIDQPTMGYLLLKEEKRDEAHATSFFLEPSAMSITMPAGDFRKATITGSKSQSQMDELTRLKEPVRKEMEGISILYAKKGEEYRQAQKNKVEDRVLDSLKYEMASIQQQFEPYNRRMSRIDREFFERNPQSYVTAYQMRFYVSRLSLDTLQMIYDRMGKSMQETGYGKELGEEIRKLKNGSPGSRAGVFSAMDINGKKLNLSDYRSKYVLLDFWASWCVPCRKGNPHLKQLYAKYKDKGLELIGISDDDSNPDAWHKAVEKDGLPWLHVLRGLKRVPEGYDRSNDISELYGIHTLPTKILINPEGVIIGRYGEKEEELDKKLREVFGD